MFPRPLQRSRVVPALSRVLGRGAASRATGMDAPRPFAGVRVLVVDDDAINRTIAEHMIAGLGGAVAFASDGRSALANLATESFDLVLMDCEMPDLDGGTVTRLARERGVAARRGGPVPIVAVTAHVMPQHHELCYAAGMDGVLTKPLTAVAVASTLGRFISADGAAAAAMN